jgi:hypothetical protein
MAGFSSADLRRELSLRNCERALELEHEQTYGEIPSVIYRDEEGRHGNFLEASYRAICSRPEWNRRLKKQYSGGKWVPRAWERHRCELDCANSSDALLMNIFCYPKALYRPQLCALLGIQAGLKPEFGYKPRIPLANGRGDRTEIDMKISNILVEAKLTETGFQSASTDLLLRYRDLKDVFDIAELPITGDVIRGYQVIRGVLAAYTNDCMFMLLCDERRADLRDGWFSVVRAVRRYSFRNRLKILTWQEIARTLPKTQRRFLEEKYGISSPKERD